MVTEEFHKHQKEIVEEWAVIKREPIDKIIKKGPLKAP